MQGTHVDNMQGELGAAKEVKQMHQQQSALVLKQQPDVQQHQPASHMPAGSSAAPASEHDASVQINQSSQLASIGSSSMAAGHKDKERTKARRAAAGSEVGLQWCPANCQTLLVVVHFALTTAVHSCA